MTVRLKVLVSAYACSPYQGSEGGVGWGFVYALAMHHDLWVIVEEEKFKADIERFLTRNPEYGDRIRFFFVLKKRNRFLRKVWPPSYYRYYRQWHAEAYRLAEELHRRVRFDVAHQLTMVGFREPGYLWKLGIPFVWGPIGGMGLFPWRFLPAVGIYGSIYYLCYNLYNVAQMRFMRRARIAAHAAGCGLITATPENRDGAMSYWGAPSTIISEVGLPGEPMNDIPRRARGEALSIVWTGQHKPGKALNLGLRALARLHPQIKWDLHVLGAGPMTPKWKRMCANLGIGAHCHFHGWLPRAEALQRMRHGHVMLITSLRDLTSTATVEALAMGLPVVCLDHCGFAEVVDESCGIKIPVTTPRDVVAGIAAAIAELERDEEKRRKLAWGALRRARTFSWERKASAVNEIYLSKTMKHGSPESSGSLNEEAAP